jgi:hypothetical protein
VANELRLAMPLDFFIIYHVRLTEFHTTTIDSEPDTRRCGGI